MIYALIGVAFIAALTVVFYGLRPLVKTGDVKEKNNLPLSDKNVTVSVVVYADALNDSLRTYIDSLMRQDYSLMKVIIVCDATSEAYSSFSDEYAGRYNNLHFTFIPPGSHNISRHKLAYMVGIKGADSDIVITTNSFCQIPSDSWISEMMRPFCLSDTTDVVLGYTSPDFKHIKSLSRWFRQFDYVMTSASWIGYALSGKTYRGDGANLAFRRKLFFVNNGYASSNRIHGGDDDIFLSEICTSSNTYVNLKPDSILTLDWGISTSRLLVNLKERYKFMSHYVDRSAFIRKFILNLSQWIMLLCVGAAIALSALNSYQLDITLMRIGIASTILIAIFGYEIFFYRRVAERLSAVRLWWSVPIFILWQPLADIIFYFRHRKERLANFTWISK